MWRAGTDVTDESYSLRALLSFRVLCQLTGVEACTMTAEIFVVELLAYLLHYRSADVPFVSGR